MTQDTLSALLSSVKNNQANTGARFSLRKRSIRNEKDVVNLSSYNSDFLSGIFADVAKANVLSELGISQKRGFEHINSDASDGHANVSDVNVSAICNKKSRIALNRCLSKVGASSINLTQLTQVQSPKGINEFFGVVQHNHAVEARKSLAQSHHHDSLAFQLDCVAGDEDRDSTATASHSHNTTVGDAARVAFPNLPATVSDSSCDTGLTRALLVRHVTTPENDTKESFGWFVDLDDHQTTPDPEALSGLPYIVSSDDLAFQASTAPKRVNDDAEVEWAKAADTVDDVLGDFF
jgi:hypothetical protein